jgi:hypothetical protein
MAANRPAFIEIWEDDKDAMQKTISKLGNSEKKSDIYVPKGFNAYHFLHEWNRPLIRIPVLHWIQKRFAGRTPGSA